MKFMGPRPLNQVFCHGRWPQMVRILLNAGWTPATPRGLGV